MFKIIISFLLSGFISLAVFGQTTTFTATSGDWSNASNWNNGVPTSSNPAVISVGSTCTIDISNAQCASLTLNGGNGETRVLIGSGAGVTVGGSVTFNPPSNGSRTNGIFMSGNASLTCNSLTMNNSVNNNRDCELNLSGGVATVNGNIVMNGTATRNAINFSGTAILNVSGSISGGGVVAGTGTINFNNSGAQTIPSAYTYNHITISGSGIKTLGGTEVINNLTVSSGTLSLGANTLTVNGTLSGAGTIRGSSSSSLIINNSGTLQMDQTNASTRTIQNLTFNAASGTLNIPSPIEIVGTLTPTAGTVASNGNITIISNGSVEGRIGVTGAGASVSGSVVIQKFIPAGIRRWLHIGSPVQNFTWNQLLDDILISGPGAGGFDVNGSNFPSAFTYEEDYDGDCGPNGWEYPNNVSNSVPVSRAMKIFFRGDRNPERLNFSGPAPNAVTIDFIGTVNSGSINMPITYTNHGNDTWDGWNFIPNPYPSPIDWNAASGWTRNRVGGTIYVWNATAGTYATWNGSSGTNGMSNGRIAMGQGFWVKANQGGGTPTLTMNENVKVGTSITGFFKTDAAIANTFRISMVQDSVVFDDVVFNFNEAFDRSYQKESGDALKLVNSSINIWSVSADNENLVINNYPLPQETDTVVLGMTSSTGGIYTLNFSTDSIPSNILVYLIDEFRGGVIDVRKEKSWRVLINADPKSYALGRLKVVFSNVGTTIWTSSAKAETSVKQQARVEWNSNKEVYTTKYEVQHSVDSIRFATIYTVQLNDTLVLNSTSYSYTHENPVTGANYYRVVRYGINNIVEFSDVHTVHFTTAITNVPFVTSGYYSLYPVPAINELHLSAVHSKYIHEVKSVSIMNMSGQRIENFSYTQGVNRITFNVSELPAGNYLIQLTNNNGEVNRIKFSKSE